MELWCFWIDILYMLSYSLRRLLFLENDVHCLVLHVPPCILSYLYIYIFIIFIGGWDGTTHLKSGEVYDPETNSWSFISSANTARWDAGVAVDGEKIYVVGGCDRNAICTLQTECYNIELDQWDQVTSLPVATHGLKCCTIQLPSKFV